MVEKIAIVTYNRIGRGQYENGVIREVMRRMAYNEDRSGIGLEPREEDLAVIRVAYDSDGYCGEKVVGAIVHDGEKYVGQGTDPMINKALERFYGKKAD